ncbi:MAG: hypothetical protein ACI8ZN_000925 [Bacteroidia bacterium]|jgi:hypothetical protein
MELNNKHLHVVVFDIPYPANYGGVIDIYYRLVALSEKGVKVHLHCYQYGRSESAMLKGLCHKIYYYKRKIFKNPIYNTKPYIVASRNSTELIENLVKDNHPIMFEGLHCTFYLADERLKDRFKIVRTHNIEHLYYKHLERVESNLFKQYFFKIEANRLKRYEKVLKHANVIAAISPNDQFHFQKKYGNTILLSPFHVNNKVSIRPGIGKFMLYHGNLSVGENNEAATFLINKVLKGTDYPLVIAGNDPTEELKELVANSPNVTLKSKITSEEINNLISDAQINILHTNQDTGIKLKLINALFMGRHCIANIKMIKNTGMEDLCIRADKPSQYKKAIEACWNVELSNEEINKRIAVLNTSFNNAQNLEPLMHAVFNTKTKKVVQKQDAVKRS